MKYNAQDAIAKAVFETLEGRTCMSAATMGLQDGVLTIQADPNTASTVKVQYNKDHSQISASVNGNSSFFPSNKVQSLVLTGSNQADLIYVDPHLHLPASIQGRAGNDTLWGGSGLDTIDGGSGNDLIHGHGIISCGDGNDTIWGSDLGDTLYAGSGNDLIIGGSGSNNIYGGSGNDTLIAGTGADRITAGTGANVIYGSRGPDTLVGGPGADTIYGGPGENVIVVNSDLTVVHATSNNVVANRSGKRTKPVANPIPPAPVPPPVTNPAPPPTPAPVPPPVPPPPPAPPAPPSPLPPPAPTPVADPSAPQAVINQVETAITASEGVNVDALKSTLHNGTVLTTKYEWDFGDTGSKYNDLTGWNAGHVYNTPGTYTITLTITDSKGLSSTVTSNVTVTADNRPVIYVDVNGSDNNNGSSPAQAVQSAARAFALAGNNTKIEFARGETFLVTGTLNITGHDIYVGAYGTGANPVLKDTDPSSDDIIAIFQTTQNTTIDGLTFDTPNTVTSGAAPDINTNGVLAGGTNVVVENSTFLTVEDAVDGEWQPTGIIVQNNSSPLMKGLRGYFCWVDGSEWSILGNTVVNTTRQHVVRGNDTAIVAVLIHDNNFSKEMQQDDPSEIWKTTINFRAGNYVYISGNTLNDSTVSFCLGLGMTTSQDTNWVVVEDNDFHNTQLEFTQTVHHIMVRDNYFDAQGRPQILVNTGDLTDPYGHVTDLTITDNTGVATDTSTQFIDITAPLEAGSVTLTHNLFAAPNLQLGWNLTAAVAVQAPDLSGFAQISDNIWPAPISGTQGVPGVVNYVSGFASPTNYLTPAQWDAQGNVNEDQFVNETLPSGVYELTVNGVTAGASGFVMPG